LKLYCAEPNEHRTCKYKADKNAYLTIYPDDFYVEITVTDEVVTPVLTTTEFKLLTYLARNPRKVCSREELLDACLPEGDSLDRTVDSHMSKLRKKLEMRGSKGSRRVSEGWVTAWVRINEKRPYS
jgi:DNA-binding response OmpR family regulator